MASDDLASAVERGDPDELVRRVDGATEARDWAGLLELRDRCERAVERGRQLWGVAHLAEYRLALRAPGPWAARVLVEGAGRFALGPLPEVAASTHGWAELAPHAPPGPAAALCAHERVVRGEDLTGRPIEPPVLDVPARLERWEPHYAVATYRDDSAEFPMPPLPPARDAFELPDASRVDRREDPGAVTALLALGETWATSSGGAVRVAAVRGGRDAAVSALGARAARGVELDPAAALAVMAWAAASGGAHGRRRGAAPGRLDAWVAAAGVCDLAAEWPPPPRRLGERVGRRRWWWWVDDAAAPGGWSLRLAVEDPATARAWAVAATDRTAHP